MPQRIRRAESRSSARSIKQIVRSTPPQTLQKYEDAVSPGTLKIRKLGQVRQAERGVGAEKSARPSLRLAQEARVIWVDAVAVAVAEADITNEKLSPSSHASTRSEA